MYYDWASFNVFFPPRKYRHKNILTQKLRCRKNTHFGILKKQNLDSFKSKRGNLFMPA